MSETLKITPAESVEVESSDETGLLIHAIYQPGKPPPRHFHPEQDEYFDVLHGAVRVECDGDQRTYSAGETIEIPRGTVHTFWCPGGEPAEVRWRTVPAGRTLQWFRAINQLQVDGRRISRYRGYDA